MWLLQWTVTKLNPINSQPVQISFKKLFKTQEDLHSFIATEKIQEAHIMYIEVYSRVALPQSN